MYIQCRKNWGPFIQTDEPSKKIFLLADRHPTAGSNVANLHHNVRKPACIVDMVPELADNSLLSWGKFADAGYVSICNRSEVNVYNKRTVKITVSEEAVLKGFRCPTTGMWRIPLQNKITNINTQTLLFGGPTGLESKNPTYNVPNTAAMLDQINMFAQEPDRLNPTNAINNIYELPSIGRAIRYIHAYASFPTRATWLKAIRKGNYIS